MEVIPPTDLGYDVSVQETPVADLLLLDDPSLWEGSFTSLLMGGDPQISRPLPALSSLHSLATTTTNNTQSTQKQQGSHLFSSEEDSWSVVEEQMLREAMADNIFMMQLQPIITWQRIADALPWRAPSEVFNRAKQLLQRVQRDLSTVMSQHQQQQQEEEEKQQQVRKRWSEEEDDKFRVGVKRYGWGKWKMVATLIPGRTVPQVTSHAQKYIKKHNNHPIPKRRRIN